MLFMFVTKQEDNASSTGKPAFEQNAHTILNINSVKPDFQKKVNFVRT